MSATEILLVAVGAAGGAALRYLAGHVGDGGRLPWGTAAVNVVGSLLLGLFTALALGGSATALLGTGFCGALTTYSSFAVQTHRLGGVLGGVYAIGTIVVSLAACSAGFWLGA